MSPKEPPLRRGRLAKRVITPNAAEPGIDPNKSDEATKTSIPQKNALFATLPTDPNHELVQADGVETIQNTHDLMMQRYRDMESNGVTTADELEDPPPVVMLMVDETQMYNGSLKSSPIDMKQKSEAAKLIGDIARLGRSARIRIGVVHDIKEDVPSVPPHLRGLLDYKVSQKSNRTNPTEP